MCRSQHLVAMDVAAQRHCDIGREIANANHIGS
jgi:hypothetical protein